MAECIFGKYSIINSGIYITKIKVVKFYNFFSKSSGKYYLHVGVPVSSPVAGIVRDLCSY